MTDRESDDAGFSHLARSGQISLGLIWLVDGILQFQPYMFHKTFVTGVVLPNAAGQPGFIGEPIRWIASLIEPHVAVFNGFAAVVQCLIGLGLLNRRTVKPALLLSLAWAPGVWFTGEGFGGFFNGTADPLNGAPGAVLLYALIALIVWPRSDDGRFGTMGLLGARGAQVAWSAIWGCFAILWVLPRNDSANAIHNTITSAPTGAAWLTSVLNTVGNATAGDGSVIAIALALASTAIAIAIPCEWHERAFLYLAIAIALAFWVFGQAFGGVLTGQATDVNSGPLLILMAALLLGGFKVSRGQTIRAPTSTPSGRKKL